MLGTQKKKPAFKAGFGAAKASNKSLRETLHEEH
jgi:hypothetical protein